MPAISAPNLAILRDDDHKIETYLSVLKPRTLLAALVNDPATTQGDMSIPFDSGVPGIASLIQALQEVWVGTAAGLDDIGRARLRTYTSGDGGLTGTITVAPNSIRWADNLHLTIKHDYSLRPMYPFIESDGTFKKDGDIAYSDQNQHTVPVCIGGPHRAGFLAGGSCTFYIDMSPSYDLRPLGAINYYDFSVEPNSGFTRSFNTATGIGTITFTVVGQYWLKFVVEGNASGLNYRQQVSYRCFFVHDPSPASANFPIRSVSVNNLGMEWDEGTWSAQIDLSDNATLTNIPDKTLAVLWCRPFFQGVEGGVGFLPGLGSVVGNDNTLMVGYISKERITQDRQEGTGTVDLEIRTVDALLREHYMFSISLEAKPGTPTTWYEYVSWLTVGRAIHHLFKYHSTVMEVCDVYGLKDNVDGRAFAEMEDGNLYSLADTLARQRGVRAHLVCDRGGRLRLTQDAQLLTDAERTALTEVAELLPADQSGKFTIIREPLDRTPFVYVSGFFFDGTFDEEGKPNAVPLCAIAPGSKPGDEGATVVQLERQVFRSQTHANQIAGRTLATTNQEYVEFRVNLKGNYLGVLEPALAEYWKTSLNTVDTERGIVWTNKHLFLRSVQAKIDTAKGTIQVSAAFEPEVGGPEGTSTDCPTFPDTQGDDPPIPTDETESGAIATASSVYYLPPTGDWVLRTAEATLDMGADPWWQVKQDSVASADAILWRTGVGFIKRSTDGGQTWVTMSPGNPPGGTLVSCEVIRYEGSFPVEDEHLFLVREENGGSWSSWLLKTSDDGSSWAWAALSTGGGGGWGTTEQFLTAGNAWKAVYLTSNLFVAVFTTPAGTFGKGGYIGHVVAGVTSGNSITYGTFELFHNGDATTEIENVGIVALDSTRFVLGYQIEGQNLKLVVGQVESDDTITLGAPVDVTGVEGGSGGTGTHNGAIGLLKLETDRILFISRTPRVSNVATLVGYICTTSALTLSVGSQNYLVDCELSVNSNNGSVYDLAALTTTKFVMSYNYATTIDASDPRFVCCSISGSAITPGAFLIDPNSPHLGRRSVAAINSTTFMAVNAGSYYTFGTVSGTTITLTSGDYLYPSSGSGKEVYNLFVLSASVAKIIVETYSLSPDEINLVTLAIDAGMDTATISATSASLVMSAGFDSTFSRQCNDRSFDDCFVHGYVDNTNPTIGIGSVVYCAGEGYMALGMSIGKAIGDLVYITGLGSSGLLLKIFDVVDMTLFDEIGMGNATEAQITSREWVAWPFCPLGSDETCYIYGRMNAPASFQSGPSRLPDSPAHVILTLDAGLNFVAVETGWGADHCGSITDGDGSLFAIRNSGSSAKLYTGVDSLTLRNALLFPAGVNPMALAYDWYNSVLYAGANDGNSIMVIRIYYPFAAWENITFSHGTANGINSVVVL